MIETGDYVQSRPLIFLFLIGGEQIWCPGYNARSRIYDAGEARPCSYCCALTLLRGATVIRIHDRPQKNMYSPMFTHHIWFSLLCSRTIFGPHYHVHTLRLILINTTLIRNMMTVFSLILNTNCLYISEQSGMFTHHIWFSLLCSHHIRF